MKRINDTDKIIRWVLVATSIFITATFLALAFSPAKADHTTNPVVSLEPDGRFNIDATHTRGEDCGLYTGYPDVAGVFYDYVTNKLTDAEYVKKMTAVLISQGYDPGESRAFAKAGVTYCSLGKES